MQQPAQSAPGPSRPAWRRWLSLSAKGAISAVLVGALVWKVPVGRVYLSLKELSATAILAVLVFSFAYPALCALRWQRALAWLGTKESFGRLLADTLVSSTYNMLLPTSLGGDVIRALRCAKRLEKGHQAWSSALFERLVGLVGLALLSVPGLMMVPSGAKELGIVIGAFALLTLGILFIAPAPFRLLERKLAERSPQVAGVGAGIAKDLQGPFSKLGARLEMMGWSLFVQLVALGILMAVVVDWGQAAQCWAILGAIPLALILTLIPISVAGLGLRESLFVVLLGRFGMGPDRALVLAIVWLGSALLVALAGALVMLVEAGTQVNERKAPVGNAR